MTYKHIGFSDSIVMKELEKIAREKNLIQAEDPIEQSMLKIASRVEGKGKEINLTASTGDVFDDAILIAAALRNRGFVTQAENLEARAILYKQAYNDGERPEPDTEQDKAKYGFWSEEGKDLIDAAHEVDSFDKMVSSLDEGFVENINEIQERMIASTNKQPTGNVQAKQASKKKARDLVILALSALDNRILKEGQG